MIGPEPYLPRLVDRELREVLAGLPAVSIEGARGVGKTATASRLAAATHSLDDPRAREVLAADPARLGRDPSPVFIDEWQYWPPVWDSVRHAVDHGAAPGSFLLAGSATPVGARIHTGAGRIASIRMRPLSLTERGIEIPTVSLEAALAGAPQQIAGETAVALPDYAHEIASSGFPGMRGLPARMRDRLLEGYVEGIVTREFPQQGHPVRRPATLTAWLAAYASATATNAAYSTILDAATPGESDKPAKTTTIAYRDILESLWLLDEVPAWAPGESARARLTQAPKHFLADPALAAVLLGLDESAISGGAGETEFDRAHGSLTGRLFEALVALSLKSYAQAAGARVSHLRTSQGRHEVDFIVERKRAAVAIEVKLAATVDSRDVRHLLWLKDRLGPRLADAMVVTAGRHAHRRPDGIAVVPAALLGP
ncbi:MAG: DUF4143 domain-containing protein [Bifidobacteriaceae bacterium]|jgi:predicted AAA+ superfamily ATPase|nr:DUF4143 domain-containing protein [Bifidobacteriaceae bacterium]